MSYAHTRRGRIDERIHGRQGLQLFSTHVGDDGLIPFPWTGARLTPYLTPPTFAPTDEQNSSEWLILTQDR